MIVKLPCGVSGNSNGADGKVKGLSVFWAGTNVAGVAGSNPAKGAKGLVNLCVGYCNVQRGCGSESRPHGSTLIYQNEMKELSKELAEKIKDALDKEVPNWSPRFSESGCEASKDEEYGIDFGAIYVNIKCRINYKSIKHDGDYYCPPCLEEEWRYEVIELEVWDDGDNIEKYQYPGIKGEIKE